MSLRPLRQLATSLAGSAGPSRLPISGVVPHRALSSSAVSLSGHSRWSKIRHKKGAADAARGGVFSRAMNDVHIALRPPGSHDPEHNPRLAAALAKAKEVGVPKVTVEAAFARARKIADGGKPVLFESVYPGGKVAMMIECVTDNQNRTVSRIKELLNKKDARLTPVAFLFEHKAQVRMQAAEGSDATFDSYFEAALDGGAEDVREVETEDGIVWEAVTASGELSALTTHLTSPPHDAVYALRSSELAYIPIDPVSVLAEGEAGEGDGVSEDKAEGVLRLVELLEDEPEVVKVWTNLAE